jgi:3'(2'), 5'-bisphosphate nucleotidase
LVVVNFIIYDLQVKSSLLFSDGRIVEKNDQTPVTVADFGVQALVSLGNYL